MVVRKKGDVSVEFHKVKFTNLDKVLYPSLGITKYQIIDYYIKAASKMLDFLQDRAITLCRFPDGVRREGFYEKNAPKGKPYWVKTFRQFSESARRDVEYIVCEDVETLAWLANLAALEISIPLSKTKSQEKPDLVLFDIDPEPPANLDHAVDVALALKLKLDLLGLKSYVKTTGKKGLHVVLPIIQKYTFKQTLAFVHQMGKILANESDLVVSEFRQSKVPGTVYVDYMQNIRSRTMICPYSLRGQELAPVSTPLDWQDLRKGLKAEDFNIVNVLERESDPWEGFFESKQSLDFEGVLAKDEEEMSESVSEVEGASALREYARKRDFQRTHEPRGRLSRGGEHVFVVQEHHARSLHHDFRLAREGVLKSWAVPKGVPEEAGTKRLAIQTEDHPLEYAEFEGTIPEGQYGAGMVRTWDKGTYKVKNWRKDKIEFFLKGSKLSGMYALIKLKKTSMKSYKQNEWLLLRMKE